MQDDKTPQPGSQGLDDRLESPSKSEPDNRGASLTARQRVEYFCGLGGVRPAADGSTDIEFGSVSFDKNNSKASITLNGPANNSAMIKVLNGLNQAARELQRLGGCCDSFSVLLNSTTKDYIELHQVPFWTIRKLRELVIDPDIAGHFGRGADFFLDLISGADFMSGHTVDAGSLQHWVMDMEKLLAHQQLFLKSRKIEFDGGSIPILSRFYYFEFLDDLWRRATVTFSPSTLGYDSISSWADVLLPTRSGTYLCRLVSRIIPQWKSLLSAPHSIAEMFALKRVVHSDFISHTRWALQADEVFAFVSSFLWLLYSLLDLRVAGIKGEKVIIPIAVFQIVVACLGPGSAFALGWCWRETLIQAGEVKGSE